MPRLSPCRRTIPSRQPISRVAITAAVLLATMVGPVLAKASREGKREVYLESRQPGTPVLAVVSLSDQRVTVYDAQGWIMRAPISSGQPGYETPAGVYSVIQKEAEHYSNLYDDASMPFMQRITWSGIALHAGPLPGYAASHGCVRMPHEFARRLFDLSKLGMRVIISRHDIGPAEFTYPMPLKPPASRLAAINAALASERNRAAAAAKRAEEARLDVLRKSGESARASWEVRIAEATRFRAESHLRAIDHLRETAGTPEGMDAADEARARAVAKLSEADAQLEAAKADAQPKTEATVRAREQLRAAEAEKNAALEAVTEANRKLTPISIFVSRKTQRLYVRQAFTPMFDIPVTITDPDRPIGTHIFTAFGAADGGEELHWTAVSMTSVPTTAEGEAHPSFRHPEHHPASVPGTATAPTNLAKAAVDRVTIPPEAAERLGELLSAGSSLIVSDEALSNETGNGTDFIVVMSGEPQGGIKIRHHNADPEISSNRFYDRGYRRVPSYDRSAWPYASRPSAGGFFSW